MLPVINRVSSGNAFTITFDRLTTSILHAVVELVASTLYVVLTNGFAEKEIANPVPATEGPTEELSVFNLN